MKILSNISKLTAEDILVDNTNYTLLKINENQLVSYKSTNHSNSEILSDLLEHKAYATALLFLNENYELEVGKFNDIFVDNKTNVVNFYKECESLLKKNIKIVEDKGVPLVDIKGYKIYESDIGIIRGNGKKKIYESFNSGIDLENITLEYLRTREFDTTINGMSQCPNCNYIFDTIDNSEEVTETESEPYSTLDNPYNERTVEFEVTYTTCPNCSHRELEEDFPSAWVDNIEDAPNAEELVPGITNIEEAQELNEEGTQCGDIAPKVDQDMGVNIPKKKYNDLLISDLDESANDLINRGFLKNSKGQYQRGNYILVKEGNQYFAIHKDKLNESKNH